MDEARKELIGDGSDEHLSAEEAAAKRAAEIEEEGRRIASQWISDSGASDVRL